MATWHHQQQAGLKLPSETSGYVMVSDGNNLPQSRMSFGSNEKLARSCLANYRKNQPSMWHYLYFNGKLV